MTKSDAYANLVEQLASLLAGERDWIANAANTAALIGDALDEVNWVGFYFARGDELVVGPFQGKPACARIALDRGVCGAAARRRETLVVPDVRDFPGHVACDAASRSEIVVPIVAGDRLVGVLDLDSPVTNRFDEEDREGLERVVETFVVNTDLENA
ncbi:MAG: GAF domain-containing protein [Pirellulales bacterium]|nr:GAF domain-containing protein [Pirellulales bacterium]